MTHKKVNNADAGTATKFGGNDLDKWSDWASGVDVDDYDINSDFSVRSGKRKLRNPANTFDYIETAGAIAANRIVNEPVLVATDTRVYQDHIQAMIGKTMDHELNTFSKAWSGYDYVIYKSGTVYKCRDMGLGTTVSTDNTDVSVVMNFALTNGVGKDIYVATGTYTPTTEFTFIGPRTRIKLSPGAIIQVPNAYAGHVFNLSRVTADTTSLSNITIDGGQYQEAGTPANNWDCIFISNTNGTLGTTAILFDRFMNMYIRHAGEGIHLQTSGDRGWINGNIFQNIVVDNAKTGILFDYTGTVTDANGANRNHFNNFIMQCNVASTVGGLIDVSGEGNIFNDCKIWDIGSAGVDVATSCNVHQRAKDTLFLGGIVRTQKFTDLGFNTMFIDVVSGEMYPWLKAPSRKKFGYFQGVGETVWSGILSNMTPVAGHTATLPAGVAANGSCVLVTTPASGAAGWKSSRYVTMRDWRPRIKGKFRLTSASAVRMFIGFKAASADLTADNYLSADQGIGLGVDSTLTNFRLLRNDSAGNTITASTGVPVDAVVREFEIWYDQFMGGGVGGFNFKLQVPGSTTAISNIAGSGYTTDIPALGTELRAVCQVGATTTTTKGLELYYLEVESDK